MLKLGDKVKFNKYYTDSGMYVDFDNLTKEQQDELDNYEYVTLPRKNVIDLSRMTDGIIVGVRRIIVESRISLETFTDQYTGEPYSNVINTPQVVKQIYIVATNLRKMYKVDPKWLIS